MILRIIILLSFIIVEIFFVPIYQKNGGSNHKLLTTSHLLILLSHIVFLLLMCIYPHMFSYESVLIVMYLSWLAGAGIGAFNVMLVYKMHHSPIKANFHFTLKEICERKESFEPENNSVTVETENLFFIFPQYKSIIFYDFYLDERKKNHITFSGTAAFHRSMIHPNAKTIMGPYVRLGNLYERKTETKNLGLGAFIWNREGYRFYTPLEAKDALKKASEYKESVGFSQMLLIHNGKPRPLSDIYDRCQCFRVLAEYRGSLCIIEGKYKMYFSKFLEEIQSIGLTNAIYLDMGTWMNVSWYRDEIGKALFCFPKLITRPGNQLMFSMKDWYER